MRDVGGIREAGGTATRDPAKFVSNLWGAKCAESLHVGICLKDLLISRRKYINLISIPKLGGPSVTNAMYVLEIYIHGSLIPSLRPGLAHHRMISFAIFFCPSGDRVL
jgi:hypothetical protein